MKRKIANHVLIDLLQKAKVSYVERMVRVERMLIDIEHRGKNDTKKIDGFYNDIIDHGKYMRDCDHAIAALEAESEDESKNIE